MIYRDFSYPAQMPYHPFLYAALFKIFNTTRFIFVGRMVSVVCDILTMLFIVAIYRRVFASLPIAGLFFGLAAAVLYVFNPLVDYANGYAWNHDVVIFCVVLSFWLFVSADFEKKSSWWRTAVIGALLTFATFMRITTALVGLVFFVMLVTQPAGSTRQRLGRVLPFLTAAAVVSFWPVCLITQAPRAFYLNVFSIPAVYGQWLHEIGLVHDKVQLTLSSIMRPGYLVLILIAAYLGVAMVLLRRRLTISNARNLLLAVLLALTFFIIALIPPTMWRQYLAMPVPFLILCFCYPLLYLRKLAETDKLTGFFRAGCFLIAACVVVAVVFPGFGFDPTQSSPVEPACQVVLGRIATLFSPQQWTPMRVHKISQDIAQRTKEPKLILTLAPLFVVEGGCDIYTELSAGSIIYRVADFLPPQDRAATHTTGPKGLKELVEKSPPSSVILGVELGFLEEPLFEAVVRPDWQSKSYDYGPTTYFRP
jgi:4-amino-4-deoxy-L-arabinose transferase-like glycosyltransferase